MKKGLTILLLLISTLSFSQVEKGDREIGMFGNFNAPTEGTGGSGSIAVSLTNYFSPKVSIGVSMLMSFYTAPSLSSPGDSEVKLTPFLGLFATYNFLTANGKLLPYIGAEYSFSWVETAEYTLAGPIVTYEGLHFAGGKAGLKIFITEMVNFDVNLKYQALLAGPEGYKAGNIGVNFGIGVILPRKK